MFVPDVIKLMIIMMGHHEVPMASSLVAFLRCYMHKNGMDGQDGHEVKVTLTFDHQNGISSSLTSKGHLCQI